ncbi:MAG: transposase [Nitrospirae bacterium]|nr:transposase [Nitrospirota bacterium]
MSINKGLIGFEAIRPSEEIATLDMDATISETSKRGALYSYEGEKAYQPLNTYWHERDILLHTEFRDGNVPAGYEQRRVLEEALKCLSQGVRKVRLRSDSAGYQHDLLRYCEAGDNKRFGRIEFVISCDVTKAFREAVMEVVEEDWHPIYKEVNGELRETGREYAEICFVPNRLCHSKSAQGYRYLATRREMKDRELPGMEKKEEELPFPTMMIKNSRYKIFGYVTNMDWSGDKLIKWVYGRCGKSEQAHDAVKNDFAGGGHRVILVKMRHGGGHDRCWHITLTF